MDAENLHIRYSRQLPLPGFGLQGQERLSRASVLVIGAGGLGCPVIQYLAAAGIGKIGIADGDKVELSNLHRQPLYSTDDIGKEKNTIAAHKIKAANSSIICQVFGFITNKNAFSIIENYDIVVDCTDNFATRYLLSDACFLLKKSLVFAAVFQYEGQVAVFNAGNSEAPLTTYRDLFPEPPSARSAPDCNEAGVLGVLPGLIGIIQATEVIKIITGIGESLAGKLVNYDIRTHQSMIIELEPMADTITRIPASRKIFESFDYEWFCYSGSVNAVSKTQFNALLADGNTIAIDVREFGETPQAGFPHRQIPLSLLGTLTDIPDYKNIVVFCQTGTRSAKAAVLLGHNYGSSKKVFHLAGGLSGYNLQDHA